MNVKLLTAFVVIGIILVGIAWHAFKPISEEGKPPAPLTPSDTEKSHFGTLAFDYKYVPLTMSLERIEAGFEKEAKAAAEAGAYWIRPHYTEAFAWGFIEREQGKYDWTIPDLLVKTVQKHNLHLLITFWSGPRAWEGYRKGLWDENLWVAGADALSWPSDMGAYLAWLKAMVERYDGDGENDMPGLEYPVMWYEVINEPCLDEEEKKEKYFDLLKRSYQAIKEVNPETVVMVGGLGTMIRDLRIFLEGGMAPYTDVINWHQRYSTEEVLAIARGYAAENKPMWVTEIWYGQELYRGGVSPTLEEEKDFAKWLAQTYAWQFGGGVEKIFHVEILGNIRPPIEVEWPPPETQQLGSCLYPEDEGRPRLAYFTHKLLASKIGRFDSVEAGLGGRCKTYKFTQEGKRVYILWVEGGRKMAELHVQSQRARVTNLVPLDKGGGFESFEVEAEDGKITLEVSQDPLLVEEIYV